VLSLASQAVALALRAWCSSPCRVRLSRGVWAWCLSCARRLLALCPRSRSAAQLLLTSEQVSHPLRFCCYNFAQRRATASCSPKPQALSTGSCQSSSSLAWSSASWAGENPLISSRKFFRTFVFRVARSLVRIRAFAAQRRCALFLQVLCDAQAEEAAGEDR
jgi:hypothetical protein